MSQSKDQWFQQINEFSKTHRVVAVDMRGHGDSENAIFGHRISRYATDLHELMCALNLHDAIMMGHSMGCSIIWSLFDLFGAARMARCVFVDMSPFLCKHSQTTVPQRGGAFDAAGTFATADAFRGDAADATTRAILTSMFTESVSKGLR